MATFRVEKTKGYTVMSNHHLRNKNLTLKAKGLLSLMLSLPEEWDYTLRGLAYICKENIDAIRTAVCELEAAEYIERSRIRDEKGHLSGTEYIIYEQPKNPTKKQVSKIEAKKSLPENVEIPPFSPKLDFPTLDNPTLGNPTLENPTLGNPMLDNPMQITKELLNKNIIIKDSNNNRPDTVNPSQEGKVESSDGEHLYTFRGKKAPATEYAQLISDETGLGKITDGLAQIDRITGSSMTKDTKEIRDIMLRIIAEAATGTRRTYEFAGKSISCTDVKAAFEKLIEPQVSSLLFSCMKKKNDGFVNDLEAYIRQALVNAAMGGSASEVI
jgi:hypothetical protein